MERPLPVGLVATDLDGTLLGSDHTLGARDERALRELGRSGVVRVVATGRSLEKARQVLDPGFPIDYLVVTSGAGIVEWATGRTLKRSSFEAADAARAAEVLKGMGVDFMAHRPIPDDHRFRYRRARKANDDFERYVERNREWARAWEASEGGIPGKGEWSQFVAIVGADEAALVARVRSRLPGLSVVRCTSPRDGRSIWIEVRPPGVGKAEAVAWLAERHRLDAARTAAVGNDYNDGEMLRWSGNAFVVGNAAPRLRDCYRVVSSNDAGGFSEVVASLRRDGGGFAPAAGMS